MNRNARVKKIKIQIDILCNDAGINKSLLNRTLKTLVSSKKILNYNFDRKRNFVVLTVDEMSDLRFEFGNLNE
jgi:hypothetical protein